MLSGLLSPLLFALVGSALAASGGTAVQYNCVSGIHQAECAQICENLQISAGISSKPNPNTKALPLPQETKDRYIREEIPYYCEGIPITTAQKAFVGVEVSKPAST